MKITSLLALLLVLFILLMVTSLFIAPSGSYISVGGSAPTLIVFGKQDNVYARVQIVVTPFLSGNQQLNFTFPNGTQLSMTGPTTINLVYHNTAYLGSGVSGGVGPCIALGATSSAPAGCVHVPGSNESGASCTISTAQPMCLTWFPVDMPSPAYAAATVPWQGAHAYQYLIGGNGSFALVIKTWGASL